MLTPEKKNITDILADTDPRQADIMAEFLASVAEFHERIKKAHELNDVIDLTARCLIDPLINSSYLAGNPGECLYTMLNLNTDVCRDELEVHIVQSDMTDVDKQLALDNIDDHAKAVETSLRQVLSDRIEEISASDIDRDIIVSNWLYDIASQLKSIPQENQSVKKESFFATIKGIRKYYKSQANIFVSMKKHARSVNDVAIWYSRYLLAPAISNAEDGHLLNLEVICSLDNDTLTDDCSRIAKELGFEIEKKIDPLKLRRSIQQLCKARTGFFNPETFLYSIKPDALVLP